LSRTTQPMHAEQARAAERNGVYDPVARTCHWLIFVLVTVQVLTGWIMPEIRPTTPQNGLVDWHLSIGAVLMLVVVLRLLWRALSPTPLATTLAPWERKLAELAHTLLYVLLLLIPVLGWAAAGYFGYTVRLFGVIALPALADTTMQWAHEAGDIHAVLANVLLGLVGLHVLGALWHYFVRRDRVLQRMIPGV
jgi:cytochrome b561